LCNLIVKTKKTSPTDQGFLGCFAVAITLLAMICVAGSKTGACLNPAVGLAQTVYYNVVSDPASRDWTYLWMYIIAPWTGSVLAALAHKGHLMSFRAVVDDPEKYMTLVGGEAESHQTADIEGSVNAD